jgi:hypothetical protein
MTHIESQPHILRACLIQLCCSKCLSHSIIKFINTCVHIYERVWIKTVSILCRHSKLFVPPRLHTTGDSDCQKYEICPHEVIKRNITLRSVLQHVPLPTSSIGHTINESSRFLNLMACMCSEIVISYCTLPQWLWCVSVDCWEGYYLGKTDLRWQVSYIPFEYQMALKYCR